MSKPDQTINTAFSETDNLKYQQNEMYRFNTSVVGKAGLNWKKRGSKEGVVHAMRGSYDES